MAEKKVPEINVDEILRIGSVLERSFIEARRQVPLILNYCQHYEINVT